VSTGGTTFNSETAKFYEELGASRVILPRHLKVQEIGQIVKDCPSLDFEVFILNSGCKNIDGFCTFQHGVSEILHGQIWNLPKRLNFDRHFLNAIRRLPRKITQRLKADIFGVDSACLLNYKVGITAAPLDTNEKKQHSILRNVSSYFNFLSGIDTCGVCRLAEFKNMGVYGVKIVGRNYSTGKKIQDVKFLKTVLLSLEDESFGNKLSKSYVKDVFRKIYGMDCGDLCFFPDGM
jgi:collagenase-like PrtC family protease